MKNKALIFGLGMVTFTVIIVGSIALGCSGLLFFHIPSIVFGIGGASGLGLMCYKGGGLIAFIGCCKKFFIPVGITGTLIGFIQMANNLNDMSHLGEGLAVAMLTVFYGVVCYCIADAFVTKAAD